MLERSCCLALPLSGDGNSLAGSWRPCLTMRGSHLGLPLQLLQSTSHFAPHSGQGCQSALVCAPAPSFCLYCSCCQASDRVYCTHADFVCRPCGGIMSDLMGRRFGMRGRIWVVFVGLALGGAHRRRPRVSCSRKCSKPLGAVRTA